MIRVSSLLSGGGYLIIFGLLLGILITMPGTMTAYNLLPETAKRKRVAELNNSDIKTPLILAVFAFIISLAGAVSSYYIRC